MSAAEEQGPAVVEVARVLIEAWTHVCGVPADGGSDLFDLGGDSLTALQVIEFASVRLELPLEAQEFLLPEIFISRTPDACAAALVGYLQQSGPPRPAGD